MKAEYICVAMTTEIKQIDHIIDILIIMKPSITRTDNICIKTYFFANILADSPMF